MIFGYVNLTAFRQTYFYHPTTTNDIIVNCSLGVTLVICFICSHIFNLIVFVQNYQQSLSAASMLFMILSGIDWLINLFRPLLMAYNLMVTYVVEQFSIASDFK